MNYYGHPVNSFLPPLTFFYNSFLVFLEETGKQNEDCFPCYLLLFPSFFFLLSFFSLFSSLLVLISLFVLHYSLKIIPCFRSLINDQFRTSELTCLLNKKKKTVISLCEYRHNTAFYYREKVWLFGIIHFGLLPVLTSFIFFLGDGASKESCSC